MFSLPRTATAPFCPAEVRGAVAVPDGLSPWKRALRFAGPGLLVSVGYMDPGNWATDIEAGSRYGTALLFVVVLSSLAAIVLQTLSLRLGLVTGRDLAQMSRDRYGPRTVKVQWLLAEVAIIACDIAEVLGSALAFKLLLGVPLWAGVLLTGLDTVIVLGLKGKGFRQLEAIILGLVGTIGICFLVQLILIKPDAGAVARGLVPSLDALKQGNALYLAIGIVGATIMPHNLYLHSSIVQTRVVPADERGKRSALRLATLDTVASLAVALFINAAILILAASAFHRTGNTAVAGIEEAHRLLEPLTGAAVAGLLFGIALFASGQSSTFTGTIAGQVILEGFLNLSIPCWQRRLITRGLAIVPALVGVLTMGEHSVGKLLVLTQVVLSAQLPFAIFPLLRFTDDRALMGVFANGPATRAVAWSLFGIISSANAWLVVQTFAA
ncbi:Nramp family divalent metal transporter [Caulobacter sp. BE254]|uniref:Nramp family divalent metal transporter n=1 Tax=Caulobacter sp. BE254 TaxID=2817720 RepID=UPI00285AE446|nr:Nramp family divalent metal transporter [Caulobacter sp. BE254]MDR7118240.1 manganese transport protein [Caulobacter sp. BE254]